MLQSEIPTLVGAPIVRLDPQELGRERQALSWARSNGFAAMLIKMSSAVRVPKRPATRV